MGVSNVSSALQGIHGYTRLICATVPARLELHASVRMGDAGATNVKGFYLGLILLAASSKSCANLVPSELSDTVHPARAAQLSPAGAILRVLRGRLPKTKYKVSATLVNQAVRRKLDRIRTLLFCFVNDLIFS